MAKTQAEPGGDPVKKPSPKTNTGNRISKAASNPPTRLRQSIGSSFTLSSETILVRVGTAKKDFTFHESLLCQHSGFFSRCFRGTQGQYFMEGLAKVCKLEECEIEVFSYVNEWLYTQEIKETGNVKDDDHAAPNALMYIEIWKLADFLEMFGLMDYAINQLKKAYDQRDKTGTARDLLYLVQPCYEGTPENCTLRIWISDLFALGLGDFAKTLEKGELQESTHPDFFVDVFFTRARLIDSRNEAPWTNKRDAHHSIYFNDKRYLADNSGKTSTRAEVAANREKRKKEAELAKSPAPQP